MRPARPPKPLVAALVLAAAPAPGPPGRGPNTKPNSIITGTGPVALAGTVSVKGMSTLIRG